MTGKPVTRRAFVGASCVALCAPTLARAASKVSLGIVNSVSDAAYFIADARGYFKDEGLDVDFITMPSGAKMISSLSTGELDVSGGSVSAGLYNANEREIAVKIVADKARNAPGYGYQAFVVRRDIIERGEFKSLGDLKGRKVAIPAIGSCGEQSTLNEACKKGGIAFGDVERVYLAVADQFAALANGAIDATLIGEPFVTLMQQRGVARRFMTVDEIYPNQQAAVTTYGAAFVKNRGAATAFLRAIIRGARAYNDNLAGGKIAGKEADEIIAILAKYTTVKDAALLRMVTPSAMDPDGRPNIDGLRRDLAFIQELGLVEKHVTADGVVDLSFLEAALKDLGPYKRAG